MKNKSKFHIFLENSEILKEEYNKDKKSFLEKRFNGEETLCPKTLEAKWMQTQIMPGSPTMVPFEEQIGAEKAAVIAQTLETAMWQGDTASGNPNLSRFDGFNKITCVPPSNFSNTPHTSQAVGSLCVFSLVAGSYDAITYSSVGVSCLAGHMRNHLRFTIPASSGFKISP